MRVAAVIVAYNSSLHIDACLASCLRFPAEFAAGIFVVDNASADSTAERVRQYRGVTLIANKVNLGFAAAVNQGFRAAPGAEAILVLNPDVVLMESPSQLSAEIEHPGVGVASGQLLDEAGEVQRGFQYRRFPTVASLAFENLGLNRLWPGNPVNRRYRCLDADPLEPADVEQPAGACLMVSRSAWQSVGGLDERFFPVWFEDVDFLRRLSKSGWRVRYAPQFRAHHAGGHSVSALDTPTRQLYWYGSLLRYAAIHFEAVGRWIIAWTALLGLAPRAFTGAFSGRSGKSAKVYAEVFRTVFSYLWNGCPRQEVFVGDISSEPAAGRPDRNEH